MCPSPLETLLPRAWLSWQRPFDLKERGELTGLVRGGVRIRLSAPGASPAGSPGLGDEGASGGVVRCSAASSCDASEGVGGASVAAVGRSDEGRADGGGSQVGTPAS